MDEVEDDCSVDGGEEGCVVVGMDDRCSLDGMGRFLVTSPADVGVTDVGGSDGRSLTDPVTPDVEGSEAAALCVGASSAGTFPPSS